MYLRCMRFDIKGLRKGTYVDTLASDYVRHSYSYAYGDGRGFTWLA